MKRTTALALCLAFLNAAPTTAQSLFAARGMGVPVAATDARARILGGLGVGLLGLNTSLVNPAAAAGVRQRGISASLLSSPRTMELDGVLAEVGATRFPLLRVLYPLGQRVTATVGYGAFLDQSWAVRAERDEVVGGETVPVVDITDSNGGLAQIRLGAAYSMTNNLALGVDVGLYSGSQTVVFSREFTDDTTSAIFQRFETRVRWSSNAPLASLGFRWDPASVVRIGGAVTWAGALSAKALEGAVEDRSVQMPLQVAAGASAYLAPSLLAAVSGRWSGWNAAAEDLNAGGPPVVDAARNTWEFGAGLELESTARRQRTIPIRVGFNYAQLPFTFGEDAPAEWSVGGGLGMRIGESRANPLAVVDLSVERGQRGDSAVNGLVEEFWRVNLSVALFGR